MEAIYAFTVKDMPVSVAVDGQGESVHVTGPQIWKAQIEEQALAHLSPFTGTIMKPLVPMWPRIAPGSSLVFEPILIWRLLASR